MARDDDFMLTAEEIRLRTRKRRIITTIALSLVLVLLLATKQDPTNDEARMMNDELRLIAQWGRSCRGNLEIAVL